MNIRCLYSSSACYEKTEAIVSDFISNFYQRWHHRPYGRVSLGKHLSFFETLQIVSQKVFVSICVPADTTPLLLPLGPKVEGLTADSIPHYFCSSGWLQMKAA